MTPELFTGNVIVQGITGSHGAFHTRQMCAVGTPIVAGTSPTKAGTRLDDIPVYASIRDALRDHAVSISVVFVPAPHARGALLEAINAGIRLIICITEGIPVHDMLIVKRLADERGAVIIGPNCPGVLLPGLTKLGIIPAAMGAPGNLGIVSRSGTLTYEAASSLSARGIGQRYIIGIGGDRVHGVDFIDCLKLFESDPQVEKIVLIGEIGGHAETTAARHIASHVSKPVYGYVAGHSAPVGIQLGHAGAILGGESESARAKTDALARSGVHTADSLTELIASIR